MKPIPDETKVCGDSLVAGAGNQFVGLRSEKCPKPTTHTLRGKGLCEEHWRQALKERDRTDQSFRSYSNQLRNYGRR